jgi:hypothetical protein
MLPLRCRFATGFPPHQGPLHLRRAQRAIAPGRISAMAAAPVQANNSSAGLFAVLAKPAWALCAVAWALREQAGAWLQPAFITPALGVLSLSAGIAISLMVRA